MQITAEMVKQLRERSGAGMMECKKALEACGADLEAAFDHLRKTGAAKAAKKASRTAADGKVVVHHDAAAGRAVIVEVNSETDFVAKDDNFGGFVEAVAGAALAAAPGDVEALLATALPGGDSVESARQQLVAKVGENISVRRFCLLEAGGGRLVPYIHGNGRIGVVLAIDGGDEALGRDVAMHIAASRPVCIDESGVPAEAIAKEREIFEAQAAASGKPADIVEKMVQGRLKKYVDEVTLLGQPFVRDPDTSVGKLLAKAGAKVTRFVRYEVGEGIEKKVENFAEEVMAQARGA